MKAILIDSNDILANSIGIGGAGTAGEDADSKGGRFQDEEF